MAKIEKFTSPDGSEITGEVKGTEGKPRQLVIRHRVKIGLLVLGLLAVLSSPIWQLFIPRGSSAFGVAVPSPTSEVESSPTMEVVQFQSKIEIVITPTPFPSPSPTLILPTSTIPPTARPQILVTGECLVLDFPSEDGQPVGSFVLGSVVYPVGVWSTSQAWYLVEGGWLSPGCTDTPLVGGSLPFVSPPMRPPPTLEPTATASPRVVARPVVPSPTPAPRWSFSELPNNFNPGWCVAVRAFSVWLPDGSRYDATEDGYTYLSDGVLGQVLTVDATGWFEEFQPWACGKYQ